MLRIGVIGLGNMGRHHARHYQASPQADLVAVCDSDATRLSAYKNQAIYQDYHQMIQSELLDAVSIAVPSKYHKAVAVACLQANIAILIEKPIALTQEDAHAIINASIMYNTPVMTGHIERFNPALMALRSYIQDNAIIIQSLHSMRFSPLPKQIKDMTVLEDLAIHDVDIMAYLTGAEPSEKYALGDLKTYATLLYKYDSIACSIQVSWAHPIRTRRLYMNADQVSAILDYSECSVRVITQSDDRYLDVKQHDALGEEIRHFLTCIQSKTKFLSDGVTGMNALNAICLK